MDDVSIARANESIKGNVVFIVDSRLVAATDETAKITFFQWIKDL